jgi:hypothetical protein
MIMSILGKNRLFLKSLKKTNKVRKLTVRLYSDTIFVGEFFHGVK